jgi:hypothetical protein
VEEDGEDGVEGCAQDGCGGGWRLIVDVWVEWRVGGLVRVAGGRFAT